MPNRMDSMLSQGMGKAKSVKASLKGLVGVFRTLEQHDEAAMLLGRANSSDDKFIELWPTIRRELISHEQAELREVFPVLRNHPPTRALADQHHPEAGELEQLIAQVDDVATGRDVRKDVLQALIDAVLHHVAEEEREIFPKPQDAIGKDMAERLDAKFLACERQLAEQL